MYFSMSIITAVPPLSALVITISFLFVSSSIAFCSPLDRLGLDFYPYIDIEKDREKDRQSGQY